jgi:hypothetical protein
MLRPKELPRRRIERHELTAAAAGNIDPLEGFVAVRDSVHAEVDHRDEQLALGEAIGVRTPPRRPGRTETRRRGRRPLSFRWTPTSVCQIRRCVRRFQASTSPALPPPKTTGVAPVRMPRREANLCIAPGRRRWHRSDAPGYRPTVGGLPCPSRPRSRRRWACTRRRPLRLSFGKRRPLMVSSFQRSFPVAAWSAYNVPRPFGG